MSALELISVVIVPEPQVAYFFALQADRNAFVYNQVIIKIVVAYPGRRIVVMAYPDGAGLVFPDIIKNVVAYDIFLQPLIASAPLP